MDRSVGEPDEVARYGESDLQVADIWRARTDSRLPTLLLLHGGFWRPGIDRTHTRPMAAWLRGQGWTVAAIEYTRVPGMPDLAIADVKDALARIPELVGATEVVLCGHSAGGHLALLAASSFPPEGLIGTVALAPAADLVLSHELGLGDGAVEAFLGGGPQERPDLDPARLPAPSTPTILVHGTGDDIVPVEVSEAYQALHPATQLLVVEDGTHFSMIDPDQAQWVGAVNALEALLVGARPPLA